MTPFGSDFSARVSLKRPGGCGGGDGGGPPAAAEGSGAAKLCISGFATLLAQDEARSVEFLYKSHQLSQGRKPSLGPINLRLVLVLPVVEDSVGVELARVAHVLQ